MKSNFLTSILLIGLIFAACKPEKKESEKTIEQTLVEETLVEETEIPRKTEKISLKEYMLGNWETSYIKIEYPTYKKADSSFVFEDNFSNPNTGRAQSTYNNDGTFIAWFKQPDGTRVGETTGKWKTKGDSLFVDYPYLGKQVQAWYNILQTKEGFDGKVIYDWDDDQEFDDILIMKSKKLE
ncbi:hypothetical protein ACOSP6_05455 [Tenacibaculum sp. MEBiC06402]|uniref:hypothetical protein n=1 Tax=unclassified Tenacibaculum TaxID=2635139 RepID=UPI003B995E0E